MKKDLHCSYSILDRNIICEHKTAGINMPSTVTLHNHDGYEILLFLHGDVSIFIESEEKKLERGDLVFISPYAFHGINLADIDNYERVVINIRQNYLQELNDKDTDLSVCFNQVPSTRLNLAHLNEEAIQQFVSFAVKLENSLLNEQYGHTILAKSYLCELLVFIYQHTSISTTPIYVNTMPSIVSKIFTYIEKNLTSTITVESLAQQLHHNSDYLNRAFKTTTGDSLKHYINAKKISLAQQYLHQGYSPYDVCFMIGFNNYSSFSRNFSKQIGQSPKQYQMKNTGNNIPCF